MNVSECVQTCAMCGGLFPGPGVIDHDQVYCCDKCANMHRYKFSGLVAMAPKLMVVLSIGAIIGYLVRGK